MLKVRGNYTYFKKFALVFRSVFFYSVSLLIRFIISNLCHCSVTALWKVSIGSTGRPLTVQQVEAGCEHQMSYHIFNFLAP